MREVAILENIKKTLAEDKASLTDQFKQLLYNELKSVEATQKKRFDYLDQKTGSFRDEAIH